MLRKYLTVALRNFYRRPVYSTINIAGLVLGLSCILIIFLWVQDELKYDRYHPDNERVYKVMINRRYQDGSIVTEHWTPAALADVLKSDFPEVEQTTRMVWSDTKLFQFDGKGFYEFGCYADPSVFETLNVALIEGSSQHPLPVMNSVAISRRMADHYFKSSALGKTLRINNRDEVTVTAVFETLPEQCTQDFDFILPYERNVKEDGTDIHAWDQWENIGWQATLVKLKTSDMQTQLDLKLKNLVHDHLPASLDELFLFPMADWRLHTSFENGHISGGRISYLISFILVAIFILVIACINFMNLSTARAANRTKEVGIKKVSGASRGELLRQFLTESLLLSFLSAAFALLVVYGLLPIFNSFTGKHLSINFLDPVFDTGLLFIILFTGLLAGSYPAFFLSAFKPAAVLKGNLASAFAGARLRRTLVVFQFAMSVIIIICAWVVYDQIDYLKNKDIGFDRANVIKVRSNDALFKNTAAFCNNLRASSAIQAVAISAGDPMQINGMVRFTWEGKSDDDSYFNLANCDYDYLEVIGFRLIQGRNFSREFPSDSSAVIVTEEVVRRMGFKNPIGQVLRDGIYTVHIIGVINDFHNLGIHEAWRPTVLTLGKDGEFGKWAEFYIRYHPGQTKEAVKQVEEAYKKSSPEFPLQMSFLDQSFEQQFRTENMVSTLSAWFTVLAVLISCLGLFGLALFNTERRVKEIGVRKVLGASVSGLVLLLCRDFVKLILYAILIGIPVAYFVMDEYLKRYPYHTELNLWKFVLPSSIIMCLSVMIIGWQSGKAALENPVEALRTE